MTQFSITVRLMDDAQLETVYQTQICRDFPENERKSLERMRQLRDLGLYECCALEQNGHPCAYAMFSSAPGCACLLLDYFAVDCRMRGQGVGTAALDAIGRYTRGRAQGVILETEDPAFAQNPQELAVRRRRIAFYQRCGARLTDLRLWLYDVDYRVMFLPNGAGLSDGAVQSAMEQIYGAQFSPERYAKHVRFASP